MSTLCYYYFACKFFFFFKQKTAYEMRISDWSSDVCSSDLIIVNDKRLTERVDYWLKLEDRLTRELAIDKTLHTPVNFIVHTIQEVNDGLAHGRYFFMDVAKDGIALYQYDDKELNKPTRSEERRVGKECVRTCRYRWSPNH